MEEQEINTCLIRWQKHHDQDAATELFNGLTQFFYYLQGQKFCKKIDAESILDEAFYFALNHCDLTKASFKTFLHRTFRNKCVSQRRRFTGMYNSIREFATVDPTLTSKEKFSINEVAHDTQYDQIREDLLDAIKQLPPTESTILQQLLEGKSQSEIQQNLGLGTSKANISYWVDKSVSSLREVYLV